MEKLVIAGREFNSRLFLGTGKFNNNALMAEAIKASETEMVTVAMKRIELEDKQDDLLSHIVQNPNIQLLPNTSGVRNAEEAVFAAQMAREAFGTNWLKLEIHPDPACSGIFVQHKIRRGICNMLLPDFPVFFQRVSADINTKHILLESERSEEHTSELQSR